MDVERNQTSINIDPYSCAIKNNDNLVRHIPREVSRHVYIFFIREGVWIGQWDVLSNVYRPSPILAGVEIPLLLTICTKRYITFQKWRSSSRICTAIQYTGSKAHDEKSNDDDDDDADEDIHFDLTQQVCEKIDEGSDAKGSDAKGSDAKGSDAKGSDAKGSDAKGSDAKGSDAKGSDAKGSDAKGSDAKGSDAKGSDAKGSDAKGSDAKGSDAKGSDAKGSDAKGNDAKGSDAKGSDAKGSDAKGSDAKGSDAKGSDAKASDAKASDAAVVVVRKKRVRLIVDSESDDGVNACTNQSISVHFPLPNTI